MKSHRRVSGVSVVFCLVMAAIHAFANPVGESLRAGRARFDRSGPGALSIHQLTDKLIINWRDFSIAAGETTRFIQPSATSIALNRVVTGNPSRLFGNLEANGKVYLINPNGILVGRGGAVNTRGFVASTLDVSDASFLSSAKLRLSGDSESSVVNEGSISAIGGDVFLVGRTVENSGTIRGSTVGLGAGSEVMIVPTGRERLSVIAGNPNGGQAAKGVNNEGTIEAVSAELKAAGGNIYALAVNNGGIIRATGVRREGGRVFLSTDGGNIENSGTIVANNANGGGGFVSLMGGRNAENPATVINSGTIEARGDDAGTRGGEVRLTGDYVGLFGASMIDVSGHSGGGTALIGGDYQGGNSTVQNAQRTFVDRDSRINADALARGNGGKVIVWSDNVTRYYGSLSARGGSGGGNGGFAEVSGKEFLSFHGTADVGATRGADGSILLDPRDLTVVAVGADDGIVTATGVAFANPDTATDVTISASVLEALTGNITLEADRDLTIDAALNLASQTSGESVIFRAGDDLDINATVVTGGASLSFFASDTGGANVADAALTIDAVVGDATTGDISFINDGTGGIAVNANVVSGGTVTFNNNNGDVTRTGAATVTASTLSLTGDGNVGTSGTRLNTDVGSITLAKSGGNTFVSEIDAVNVSGATGGGDVDLLAGNAITIDAALNAGAGDVTLNATAGGVNQTAGSGITAATLEFLGAGTFTLADVLNDIDNLTANVTGPITYRDADALTVADGVVSADNAIDIATVNGTLTVNNDIAGADVDAGASTVSLTAGSSGNDNALTILGGVRGTAGITFVADHMTLTPDASGINAGTATALLRPFQNGTLINLGAADAAGTLGLTDAELDDITADILTIGDANAGTITASADLTQGARDINLITGGDITITAGNTLTTTGDASLSADGDIDGVAGAIAQLVASRITLTSGTGRIGTSAANPFRTDTADLTATSGGGAGDDIFIDEADGLTALNLNAGAGDVNLTLGAGLSDTDALTDITAMDAVVTLNGAFGALGNPIQTSVGGLAVDTSAGDDDQFITEVDGLNALNLNAGAGGIVNLTLTLGSLLDTDPGTDITADQATVALLDPTAQAFGTSGDEIATSVDDLAVNSPGGGDLFIIEANGLTGLNLNAAGGNVTLTLTEGSLADTDPTDDIVANVATLTLNDADDSGDDFGTLADPIGTSVNELMVNTSAGAIDGDQFITEADGLSALELNAGGGGNVTLLLTEGAIADTDGANDIIANIATVTLNDLNDDGDDFGASGPGNSIGTMVNDLRVNTSAGANAGDQFILEAHTLTGLALNAGAGNVTLELTEGTLTDIDGTDDLIANIATVTLRDTDNNGDDFGAMANPIGTSVNELAVDTAAGSVDGDQFVTEANALTALNLNAGAGMVNLTLTLGGVTDADAATDITAGDLTVILSDAAPGQNFGVSVAQRIQTSVGTLSVDTSAGDGSQFIRQATGLTGLHLNADGGSVDVDVGGAVTDTDAATDIDASGIVIFLTGDGAIGTGGPTGNPIEIDAGPGNVKLEARGVGGGVHVELAQAGDLTITDSQPFMGGNDAFDTFFNQNPASPFQAIYESHLTIRVNGNIISTIAPGNFLRAAGTLTLEAIGGSIGGGIANPLAIDAGTLNASADTGLAFSDVNDVTLGNISSAGGTFFIETANTLTFDDNTVIDAGPGPAILVANGSPGVSVVGTPAMNSRFLLYALNSALTDPPVIITQGNPGNPSIGALTADEIDSPRNFDPLNPDPFGGMLSYFVFSLEANPPTDPSLFIDIPVEVFQPVSIVFGEYDPTKFGEVGDLWMSSSELYEIERKAGKARKALPKQVNRTEYVPEVGK